MTPYHPRLPPETLRAMARWPDVPAVYGWLRLDRRGRWFVRDGEVTHPGALRFLNAHYGADETGCWFVQNGPQRAYVELDLAPWVLSLDGGGKLVTQSGSAVEAPSRLVVTPCGALLVLTEVGLGNLLDRDLEAFTNLLLAGNASGIDCLGDGTAGRLLLAGHPVDVETLALEQLEVRFGFHRVPRGSP